MSAEQGQGIDALVEGLEAFAAAHKARWRQQRLRGIESEVRDAVLEAAARQLRQAFATSDANAGADSVQEILSGRLTVHDAAVRLLQKAALP